ncbi:MAG: Tim44 domain-containing protein [Betaproteobacteria bacterium]|nr:Tim44 domain-containing protein [Betaproteobacteria bacterium]
MTISLIRRLAVFVFSAFALTAMVVVDAEARRLGGGRSMGRQSDNVSQRQATPPQNAPGQNQASRNDAGPQQGGATQPPRNRWLGPIAGLAAGLGIAALFSHFGMGGALAEMMGSLLLVGLLVMAGLFIWRMLRRNAMATGAPAHAGAAGGYRSSGAFERERAVVEPIRPYAAPTPSREAAPGTTYSVTGDPIPSLDTSARAPAPTWSIPPDFDVAGFVRSAKVHFVRLQAAWDAGDLNDIRDFTTPEMFAEIKMDFTERGETPNRTEVESLEAELLGIEQQNGHVVASVRFTGALKEHADRPAEPFVEVWNLVKPRSGRDGWLLAGIQQVATN